jgi:hypothetical protein
MRTPSELELNVKTRNRFSVQRSLGLVAAALLALVPLRAQAAGEQTGRISGYVYDPTGAALSEVPLTLTGGPLSLTISRTTGDDGKFEFDNLPVGDNYAIRVDVPGFSKVEVTSIPVKLGQNTPADVNLTVLTEAQASGPTVQIVERVNPILNPDSAQAAAVIEAEKAATTPIFGQVEGMAQQAAGVGPGNTPATRGGLSRYGRFYVDGLDTTDVTDGSITAPMNFDAVQNFEIIVGGTDAQYNSMGVITNAVTKTGTNKFTYDFKLGLEPTWMAAANKFPAAEPGIFGLYNNNNIQGPQTSFYQPVINLGGPIIQDKLWYYVSYQQNFSHKDSPLNINGTQTNRPVDTTTTLGRVKITYQPTANDRLNVGVNLDRNVINNLTSNGTTLQEADNKVHRGGEFFIVNYDHNFSDSTLFQLQTGVTYKAANFDPIAADPACSDDPTTPGCSTPGHRDNSTGISSVNNTSYQEESKWRWQFDPSISWKLKGLGTHQMKAGLQFSYLVDDQVNGIPGNARYLDNNLTPPCNENDQSTWANCRQKTIAYGADGNPGALATKASAANIGLFFQDRWNVNRRLTVIPGLRADMGRLYDTNGKLAANLVGMGPRLSATYDLFGDRKTLLVGSYGRSNDIGNIFIAQHANPTLFQVTSNWVPFVAATATTPASGGYFTNCGNSFPLPAGCTASGGASGRSFYTHDTSLFQKVAPNPTVDELTAGVHTEVADETVIGIDYTYRYYGHLWADEEVNQIWNAGGTNVIGYVNGISQTINVTKAPASAYRRYNGVDLWVQGTPGRWDLLASYTLSFSKGTVSDYFDGYLQNPRFTQYYDGYTPDDRRHQLKGSIVYKTPFGLDLGLRLQYRTGRADWESFPGGFNGARIIRSPRGTGFPINSQTGQPDFNDPSQISELRDPDYFNIDLQARYNLGQALNLQQRAEIVLLVVNALNEVTPFGYTDQYSNRLNNKFGFASGAVSPLQAEVFLRFRN